MSENTTDFKFSQQEVDEDIWIHENNYKIIEEVKKIVEPVYLVGGSVRDTLLDKTPKDYDFCTPLLPEEIEERVKSAGKRAFITGKRFGTVGFKVDKDFVEVTTFRNEVYGKTRKPSVEFVKTINEDLSRRDFTMNAIALRGTKKIDPFGGGQDIKDKIIRAVGNPTIRFSEDPLRMLRAVRFASQLGFQIEEKTFRSMQKNAHKILSVSKERWMQELDKLLVGDYAVSGLRLLLESNLAMFMLPEFRIQDGYNQNSDYHEFGLDMHTILTVSQVPKDINLRWAALLHDIAKPFVRTDNKRGSSNYVFHELVGAEMIYGIGKRMKWSNERIATVSELVKNHLSNDSPLRAADNSSKSKLVKGSEQNDQTPSSTT